MPYKYSKKTIIFSRLLEAAFYILLYPINFFGRKRKENYVKKILIIEPFQMGDVVSLTVMFDPIKSKWPNSNLYLLVHEKNKHVLEHDNRISQILTAEFPYSDYNKSFKGVKRYIKLLRNILSFRKYNFDIGIDTRGDVRSQIFLQILNCKKTIGYTNYLGSNIHFKGLLLSDTITPCPFPHRYDWNINALKALGFNENELWPIKFPSFQNLEKTNEYKENQKPLLILHIGGGWEFKKWTIQKWIGFINSPFLSNYQLKVIGGKAETLQLTEIENKVIREDVSFLITTYHQLINLIDECNIFIGLDSGPMNIAVCLNKKSIALFGPGDSNMWYPYNMKSVFIHKKENFPCNPCFQKICYYPLKNCMASIEIKEVVELFRRSQFL